MIAQFGDNLLALSKMSAVLDGSSAPRTYTFLAAVLALVFYYVLLAPPRFGRTTLLNPKKPLALTTAAARQQFMVRCRDMIWSWFLQNPGKPARVHGDIGHYVVLPPSMVPEINNHKSLSFQKWSFKYFHAHLPGFDAYREGSNESYILKDAVLRQLTTKNLDNVTPFLLEESTLAFENLLSDKKEWHELPLHNTILNYVARTSSRIFLGESLCRNEAWLQITKEYTTTSFGAAEELRDWPAFLRPLAHWFLPACTRSRELIRQAREIILNHVEERHALRAQGFTFNDALEWCEKTARGRKYDTVAVQLILSTAAIHTTTDLMCQVLTQLARHPETLEQLRQEITSVLGRHGGFTKAALADMKLLDSVIKECQRTKPILSGKVPATTPSPRMLDRSWIKSLTSNNVAAVTMRRLVLEKTKLSDGTVLPKGALVGISAHRYVDPALHENPNAWQGDRWVKMREEPGRESMAQLVGTSPDHLAFGYGVHACPGRFFAAREIKIGLIHMSLKYDWKLQEDYTEFIPEYSMNIGSDPFIKFQVRRRKEEV